MFFLCPRTEICLQYEVQKTFLSLSRYNNFYNLCTCYSRFFHKTIVFLVKMYKIVFR